MSPIHISNGRRRFEFKPEEYSNVDPVFLYDPKTPKKERIREMVKKLPTLVDIPKELCPKDDFRIGIVPPLFYFGLPMNLQSFFKFAQDHHFDGYPIYDIEPENPTPCLLHTQRKLRKKMYNELHVDIEPEYHSVYLSPSERTYLLCFLCSYDGPDYPLSPSELNKGIKKMFNLDVDLKWYLDSSVSDWRIGQLERVKVGRIKESW